MDIRVNDMGRFEIIRHIGSGQFSKVYKAKWHYVEPADDQNNCAAPNYHHQQQQSQFHDNQIANMPMNVNYLDNNTTACENVYNQQQTNPNVIHRERTVALKRIKFSDIPNSKERMDYLKEVKLLQQVKHPNIINFNISFFEQNELFIVLELADGGDLSKLIRYFNKKQELIPEQTILKYFTQVCSAVEYIHSKRILHRDIKPANIFMTSDGCVKLGDFGLGRFFSQNTMDAHSIVGTFYYMSPERIQKSGYDFSSDVWSLGCVLYELITLNSPFSMMNPGQVYNNNNIQNRTNDNMQKRPLTQYQQTAVNQNNNDYNYNNNQCWQAQQQPQNDYCNLQWLMDRIMAAEYPSLDGYQFINPLLRNLVAMCLNPAPNARPDMRYVCSVVDHCYDQYLNHR